MQTVCELYNYKMAETSNEEATSQSSQLDEEELHEPNEESRQQSEYKTMLICLAQFRHL